MKESDREKLDVICDALSLVPTHASQYCRQQHSQQHSSPSLLLCSPRCAAILTFSRSALLEAI